MMIPDINEQLPDLPDTASKYNEQFLEDMDHTLDVLPTWTTRLNNLATQIRNVKDWIASQLPFFQTVIDKANEIQGYVIPTEATYPAATIDEKIKRHSVSLVASGYINKKEKAEQFVFPDEPYKIYSTGDILNFDGDVVEVPNNTEITFPEAPTAKVETSDIVSSSYAKGEFAVLDRPELVENGDFSSNDVSMWVDYSNAGLDISIENGKLKVVNNTGAEHDAVYYLSNSLHNGTKYIIKCAEVTGATLYFDESDGTTFSVANGTTNYISSDYVSTGHTPKIIVRVPNGSTAYVDGLSWKQVSDTFRCIKDAPAGTSLNDTEYFEDRTDIGVTQQVLVTHKYNPTTKTYEGYNTEILFKDAYHTDTLETVMTNNGYGIESNGLFSKDGKRYLPVGIWQTLNKGAYHPWLNSLGCANLRETGGLWHKRWYKHPELFINKTSAFVSTGENLAVAGYIGGNAGRPDQKFYDKIYPSQLIDLRISAVSRPAVEVLTSELRNDLSGITEGVDGVYGVKEIKFFINKYVGISQTTVGLVTIIEDDISGNIFGEDVGSTSNTNLDEYYIVGDDGTWYQIIQKDARSTGVVFKTHPRYGDITSKFTIDKQYIMMRKLYLPILSQNTQLTTDMIGDPANYPDSLKELMDRGVAVHLYPLLVSQDGTSYIDSNIPIIWSNKNLEYYFMAFTDDNGYSWVNETSHPKYTLNEILNSSNQDSAVGTTNRTNIVQYQSKNHITKPYTDGSEILADTYVIASNIHDIEKGATVANSLTNKVSTGTDETEKLSITKEVAGVLSHTAQTQTPDVLFRAKLEKDTATGRKKIVYEYDDSLIDGTQKAERILNEY